MLPTKSNRSYSDFFTSGFRAMTNRSRRASVVPPTSATTSTNSSSSTSNSTRCHSSFIGLTNRRSRTASMIISPPPESLKTRTSSTRERRDRRSSFVTFSSWLFDRKPATQSDNYLSFSSSPPKNKRELLGSSDITEVWITAGGPFTPIGISKSSDDSNIFQPIDPFASSPDSKSFFIDLESPPSSTRSSKRESFLSLSASSSDRSFLHLPVPRRSRPTSVRTMPLPSRSSRSSYFFSAPSTDRSTYSWTLEEEDDSSRASTPEPMVEDIEERSDPAQNIDWRQFHVELLLEEA